jgi:hypothetical protein
MSRRHRSTAPRDSWERCAPTTLALVIVAAIHLLVWRLVVQFPGPRAVDANGVKMPHRPLVVTWLPEARPPTVQSPGRDSARPVGAQPPQASPAVRPGAPRAAPKAGNPPARLPLADTHAIRATPPSTEPEPVAAGGPLDWQRDLSRVREPRRFQYASPAARAAAAAGSSVQQQASAPSASALETEAARAAKTDCRTNYADMGLLAIPMLARDALSRSGCRW